MKYLYLITIVLIFYSCFHKHQQGLQCGQIDTALLGIYNESSGERGTNLTLTKEGTFTNERYYHSDFIQIGKPESEITEVLGKFSVESNRIELFPEVYIRKLIYKDSVVILDSIKYIKSDSTKIKTNFYIIKWIDNTYLLSEDSTFHYGYRMDNDFVAFANDYNSGSDPRLSQNYFAKKNHRNGHEKIELSQIPVKWRSYFLDSMIYVVITHVEKNFLYDRMFKTNISRFILKGGSSNGVKEGMIFYGKNRCCILKIMEADKLTSKGIIELCPFHQKSCKIGDTLTSWDEMDYGKYVH